MSCILHTQVWKLEAKDHETTLRSKEDFHSCEELADLLRLNPYIPTKNYKVVDQKKKKMATTNFVSSTPKRSVQQLVN